MRDNVARASNWSVTFLLLLVIYLTDGFKKYNLNCVNVFPPYFHHILFTCQWPWCIQTSQLEIKSSVIKRRCETPQVQWNNTFLSVVLQRCFLMRCWSRSRSRRGSTRPERSLWSTSTPPTSDRTVTHPRSANTRNVSTLRSCVRLSGVRHLYSSHVHHVQLTRPWNRDICVCAGVNLLVGTENGLMLLDRSGQGKVYNLINRRRFQQMDVLEGLNVLVTISGQYASKKTHLH